MQRKKCCLCGKLRYLNRWDVCSTCMDVDTSIEDIKKSKFRLMTFKYETINKCKQCGKQSPLDHDGYCFWCWEEIQEGLEMLK